MKTARVLQLETCENGDNNGEFNGNPLLLAEREAAARQGGAINLGDVIERIIASNHLEDLTRRSLGCQRHPRGITNDQVDDTTTDLYFADTWTCPIRRSWSY